MIIEKEILAGWFAVAVNIVSYVSSSLTDNELKGVTLITKGAEPPPPPQDARTNKETRANINLFFIFLLLMYYSADGKRR